MYAKSYTLSYTLVGPALGSFWYPSPDERCRLGTPNYGPAEGSGSVPADNLFTVRVKYR
jgi:hypothetical protein